MADLPLVIWATPARSMVSVLLTCGHYSAPIPQRSSVWDFPDEAHICPEGCGDRQLDIRYQVALNEGKLGGES